MKKLVLILFCLPLIFSCGDKKDKKEKDIQGYWHITVPTDSRSSLIFHFAEDGFLCTDVGINYSCGKNRERKNCDDCHSDNSWNYTNKEKNEISMSHRGVTFSSVKIRKESEDRYFLSGIVPGEMRLDRTTFTEIKRKYDERKKEEKKGEIDKTEEEYEEITTQKEREEVEAYEEEESYYGTINDSDGYTNVRSDKSSNSAILFKVYLQDEFEIIDNTDDNWWLIEYDGNQGYMYSDKIELIP